MRRLPLACVLAVLVASATLLADTTVLTDTFTEGANTALTSHTPDSGAPGAYTLNDDTSGGSAALRVRADLDLVDTAANATDSRVSYYITPTVALGSADYYVQFTLVNQQDGGADDFTAILLRRTAVDTYYLCGWYASGTSNDSYLAKVVGGTYSQIANTDVNFVDGSVVKCGMVGTTLTLYKDGASVLSQSDSEISATGAAGVLCGRIRTGATTDDCSTSLQIDNLTVVDTTAAGGAPTLSLLGVGK
jgi:hypothetical protein